MEIKTYKPIEGQKEFSGVLTAYDENMITVMIGNDEVTFKRKEIALIRLALHF